MVNVILRVVGLGAVLALLALRAVVVLGSEDGLWPSRASIGAPPCSAPFSPNYVTR